MVSPRKVLTLNKIVVQRKLPFVDVLVKDLFDSDPKVGISALYTLEKLGVTGLSKQFLNLYKSSTDDIRGLILDNIRTNPHEDYAPLVMDYYKADLSSILREKTIAAMGGVAQVSDEVRDFLRTKTTLEERSERIRQLSVLALIYGQDWEFLRENWKSLVEGAADSAFQKAILTSLSGCKDQALFLDLHKYFRRLPNPAVDLGVWISTALFTIYPNDMGTQAGMNQLQDRILQACRADTAEEVSLALSILEILDLSEYRTFATKAFSALLMGDSPSESILKHKRELLSRKFPVILEDDASKKTLASVIEKLLLRFQQVLEEAKRSREGTIGANPKKDFVEFFETLRNLNLLNTVISYLKSSPPDESRRNLILSVIKKLSPSLGNRSKQLLTSVIKLLMSEDGRIRSQLAIDCGKINLEDSLEGVLSGISLLVEFAPAILAHRCFKVLSPLHELCSFFPAGKRAGRNALKALLHSNRQDTVAYVISCLMKITDKELVELTSILPALDLIHLQPMKEIYADPKDLSPAFQAAALLMLEAVGVVDDLEWIRILYQIEAGRFGTVAPAQLKRIRILLSRGGLTSELEQYSKGLRKREYRLLDLDVEVLLASVENPRGLNPESASIIRDIAYGCLADENKKYRTEIGFVLLSLGEAQGQKMLEDALKSKDEKAVSTAIKLVKKAKNTSLWKEILHAVSKDSVLIHQQIVGFFTDDSMDLRDDAVRAEIIFLRTGERPEVPLTEEEELAQLAEEDKNDLQVLFQQMRSTHLDNKTRFEMEQNMKELTIFFIDIAGYTKRSNTSDISEIMVMLDDFGQIIQPIGERFNGNLIKKIGDCFMYTFEAPLDAVLASLEIQKQLKKHNEMTVESERLHTRIGLNTGKVFVKEDDVYGDPVNTASRVESKAPMDGLLINETTFDGVRDFVLYKKREPIQVKGIDEPLQTYEIEAPKPGVLAMYKTQKPGEEASEATD